MIEVLKHLLILYIFLLAGYLIGGIKKDKASHSDILSVLLINIFLPCKVFNTFANNFTITYFSERYTLLITSLILILVLVTIAYFGSKLLTKKEYEQKVYQYSFTLTNYAYLGYVLIESVFGEKFLSEFVFFAIPFIIYTYTFGYALLTGGKNFIKKLLNPLTIAIVLVMIVGLTNITLPEVISKAVSSSSACVGPLSMILTGMTLSTFKFKELILDKTAYIFTFIRLIVIPGIAYLICLLLKLYTVLPMVLIITAMPCGLNTVVFPKLIGEDCKPGARLALISHFFSIITLPLWLSLII
ncbi:MAG: AEC family transporter [Clostridia bacterium]|nr:AEC family transporter [Clostridia bacterium]